MSIPFPHHRFTGSSAYSSQYEDVIPEQCDCGEYWTPDGYTESWTNKCPACRLAERTCSRCGDEYQQRLPSDHVCKRCAALPEPPQEQPQQQEQK